MRGQNGNRGDERGIIGTSGKALAAERASGHHSVRVSEGTAREPMQAEGPPRRSLGVGVLTSGGILSRTCCATGSYPQRDMKH